MSEQNDSLVVEDPTLKTTDDELEKKNAELEDGKGMNDHSEEEDVKKDADGSSKEDGEEKVCRICRMEGTKDEPLRHPCKCSGSVMWVHEQCLIDWMQRCQSDSCELCGHKYEFDIENKPTSFFGRCVNSAKVFVLGMRDNVVQKASSVVYLSCLFVSFFVMYWMMRFFSDDYPIAPDEKIFSFKQALIGGIFWVIPFIILLSFPKIVNIFRADPIDDEDINRINNLIEQGQDDQNMTLFEGAFGLAELLVFDCLAWALFYLVPYSIGKLVFSFIEKKEFIPQSVMNVMDHSAKAIVGEVIWRSIKYVCLGLIVVLLVVFALDFLIQIEEIDDNAKQDEEALENVILMLSEETTRDQIIAFENELDADEEDDDNDDEEDDADGEDENEEEEDEERQEEEGGINDHAVNIDGEPVNDENPEGAVAPVDEPVVAAGNDQDNAAQSNVLTVGSVIGSGITAIICVCWFLLILPLCSAMIDRFFYSYSHVAFNITVDDLNEEETVIYKVVTDLSVMYFSGYRTIIQFGIFIYVIIISLGVESSSLSKRLFQFSSWSLAGVLEMICGFSIMFLVFCVIVNYCSHVLVEFLRLESGLPLSTVVGSNKEFLLLCLETIYTHPMLMSIACEKPVNHMLTLFLERTSLGKWMNRHLFGNRDLAPDAESMIDTYFGSSSSRIRMMIGLLILIPVVAVFFAVFVVLGVSIKGFLTRFSLQDDEFTCVCDAIEAFFVCYTGILYLANVRQNIFVWIIKEVYKIVCLGLLVPYLSGHAIFSTLVFLFDWIMFYITGTSSARIMHLIPVNLFGSALLGSLYTTYAVFDHAQHFGLTAGIHNLWNKLHLWIMMTIIPAAFAYGILPLLYPHIEMYQAHYLFTALRGIVIMIVALVSGGRKLVDALNKFMTNSAHRHGGRIRLHDYNE